MLAEYGMEVPDGITVNVVENNDNTVHITLPAAPDNLSELSDDELASAAGGTLAMVTMVAIDVTLTICPAVVITAFEDCFDG